MALKDDLETRVKEIFKYQWTTRNGTVVPDDDSVTLGNDAVKLEATVLYADLADSTLLVDTKADWFAAEVYKTFLHCASKIISSEGGVITAYDGDRVMAVFIGDAKNTTAARCALHINWVAKNTIQAAMDGQYEGNDYKLYHVCGIDTSELLVAKTGIRGSNDLVWVGRAANYAAKLAAKNHNKATWITQSVYESLHDKSKFGDTGFDMWVREYNEDVGGLGVYSSTYWWEVK